MARMLIPLSESETPGEDSLAAATAATLTRCRWCRRRLDDDGQKDCEDALCQMLGRDWDQAGFRAIGEPAFRGRP